MKQKRAVTPLYKLREPHGTVSCGFLDEGFHLSQKERVMFRFFGKLQDSIDEANKTIESETINPHKERM